MRKRISTVTTWSTGYPAQQVAGESHYVAQLRKVTRSLGGGREGEVMTDAVLVPDPRNRFDSNAVQVLIDGQQVGNLPREDAAAYAPVLRPLLDRSQALQVPCRLWWGSDYDGQFMASVSLDLPPAGLLFPVNSLPAGTSLPLPGGSKFQVTGEEAHMDVLGQLLTGRQEVLFIATLHPLEKTGAKASRMVLEVRADDRRIGELSPTTSKGLLPVIQRAEQLGVATYAFATVRGNALTAEAVVWVSRGNDIPDSWLQQLETTATGQGAAGVAVEEDRTDSDPAQLAPANWYPDPDDASRWRYWDGQAWTDHYHRP